MENNDRYPRQRAAGREHIPLYPKGFIAIRVVQLVLAVIITALCAFGIYLAPIPGNCLMIFISISTIIVTIWLIVAEFGAPRAYNYWAVLAMDIFLVFFWLCSFALLAASAAYLLGSSSYYYYGYYDYDLIFAACMAAAAGIGGLEFVLFVVSLVIHSVMLHRHRKAGLHCNPVSFGNAPVVASHVVPEKNGVQVTTDPTFQPAAAPAQAPAAPPYVHQGANYGNQIIPQQPQMYAPAHISPQ